MSRKIPEPWKASLTEIDDNLKERTDFHCIGGFVIAMLYNLKRETSDLDFISCVPRDGNGKLYELGAKAARSTKNIKSI